MEQGNNNGDGVRNLPSSFGKSFATLDDYLEHLRIYAGPIDRPWYRENPAGRVRAGRDDAAGAAAADLHPRAAHAPIRVQPLGRTPDVFRRLVGGADGDRNGG